MICPEKFKFLFIQNLIELRDKLKDCDTESLEFKPNRIDISTLVD